MTELEFASAVAEHRATERRRIKGELERLMQFDTVERLTAIQGDDTKDLLTRVLATRLLEVKEMVAKIAG